MKQESQEGESVPKTSIERELKRSVFQAAESIGEGYDGCDKRSPAELAAYADGVRNTLVVLAEQYEIELRTRQVRAAVGEALRRRNVPEQKLKSRRLNNIIEEVRDHRIAMLDRYQSLDYTKLRDWQKKLWAIERTEREGEWAERELVATEVSALRDLYDHLLSDGDWFRKQYDLARQGQQPAEEAA